MGRRVDGPNKIRFPQASRGAGPYRDGGKGFASQEGLRVRKIGPKRAIDNLEQE